MPSLRAGLRRCPLGDPGLALGGREEQTMLGPAPGSPRKWPGTSWWTISRWECGRTQVLTVPREAGEVLPVFSHEEEAELFLWFAQLGKGWRARESSRGELGSVLRGPCALLEGVALDPLPEMLEDGTLSLLWEAREHFLERVLAQEGRTVRGDPHPADEPSFLESTFRRSGE